MWETVDEMEKRHGLVPQFHGKWPFHRVLGLQVCTVYSVQYVQLSLQEPASVLFSVLNLLSNLGMLIWFMGTVPSNCSMYRCWLFYSFTAINAWVWSTVFHARYVQCTVCTVYSMYSCTVYSMYNIPRQGHGPHRDVGLLQRLRHRAGLTSGLLYPDREAVRGGKI